MRKRPSQHFHLYVERLSFFFFFFSSFSVLIYCFLFPPALKSLKTLIKAEIRSQVNANISKKKKSKKANTKTIIRYDVVWRKSARREEGGHKTSFLLRVFRAHDRKRLESTCQPVFRAFAASRLDRGVSCMRVFYHVTCAGVLYYHTSCKSADLNKKKKISARKPRTTHTH